MLKRSVCAMKLLMLVLLVLQPQSVYFLRILDGENKGNYSVSLQSLLNQILLLENLRHFEIVYCSVETNIYHFEHVNYLNSPLISITDCSKENEPAFFNSIQIQLAQNVYSDIFSSTHDRSVLILQNVTLSEIFSQLKDKNLRLKSLLFQYNYPLLIFHKNDLKSDKPYTLSEIYSYKNKLFRKHLVKSSDQNISLYEITGTQISRRTNLKGLQIVAGAKESRFTWETEFEPGDRQQFRGGFAVNMLRVFSKALNFSIKGLEVEDKNILVKGNKMPKLFHLVDVDKVDISITQFVPNLYINHSIVWLYSTFKENSLSVIFKQPSVYNIRNVYLRPFTLPLWISYSLLIATISTTFLLFTFYNNKNYYCSRKHLKSRTKEERQLLWIIASVCQQGYSGSVPRSLYCKWLIWLSSIVTMIFYILYNSCLFSILSSSSLPVQALEDLFHHQFKLYTHEKSQAGKIMLNKLIDSKKLSQSVLTTDTESEVTLLDNSQNALVSHWDLFYTVAIMQGYSELFICKSFSVLEGMSQKHSMFLKKGSPLKESFNAKIIVALERGLQHRLFKMETFVSTCLPHSTRIGVEITDVTTAFFVLLAGFLFSIIALIYESKDISS